MLAIFKTRNGKSGNGNEKKGNGTGESLKARILKKGNLAARFVVRFTVFLARTYQIFS